jgi:hypothetical protein
MPAAQKETSPFEKVAECLYRYRPSGIYYGRIETGGKEIRRSLKTRDRKVAKINLDDLRKELGVLDLHAGQITLAELCDRFLKTVQHQKPSTIEGKRLVIDRMKKFWPGGASTHLRDIRPSAVQEFLSEVGNKGGKSLYNHYVFVVCDGSQRQGDFKFTSGRFETSRTRQADSPNPKRRDAICDCLGNPARGFTVLCGDSCDCGERKTAIAISNESIRTHRRTETPDRAEQGLGDFCFVKWL